MSNLVAVNPSGVEPRREAIARRLRGKLGEQRMSQAKLAALSGINQSGLSRRLNGKMPFDIDELEAVCSILGVDLDEILTGRGNPRHPGGGDGGLGVRPKGFEPLTF
ncbi:helix-turn-helix domain-containing protein [Rhodococcus ruber]|uniref:helix-turn-helix domain-containing protein n=1 Tax=Rhodococcus ruber TaxID=1830 RepID=UPI003D813068